MSRDSSSLWTGCGDKGGLIAGSRYLRRNSVSAGIGLVRRVRRRRTGASGAE